MRKVGLILAAFAAFTFGVPAEAAGVRIAIGCQAVDSCGDWHWAAAFQAKLKEKGIPVVWLNPGADGPDVVAKARALGLDTRVACSIIGVGDSPGRY